MCNSPTDMTDMQNKVYLYVLSSVLVHAAFCLCKSAWVPVSRLSVSGLGTVVACGVHGRSVAPSCGVQQGHAVICPRSMRCR